MQTTLYLPALSSCSYSYFGHVLGSGSIQIIISRSLTISRQDEHRSSALDVCGFSNVFVHHSGVPNVCARFHLNADFADCWTFSSFGVSHPTFSNWKHWWISLLFRIFGSRGTLHLYVFECVLWLDYFWENIVRYYHNVIDLFCKFILELYSYFIWLRLNGMWSFFTLLSTRLYFDFGPWYYINKG